MNTKKDGKKVEKNSSDDRDKRRSQTDKQKKNKIKYLECTGIEHALHLIFIRKYIFYQRHFPFCYTSMYRCATTNRVKNL